MEIAAVERQPAAATRQRHQPKTSRTSKTSQKTQKPHTSNVPKTRTLQLTQSSTSVVSTHVSSRSARTSSLGSGSTANRRPDKNSNLNDAACKRDDWETHRRHRIMEREALQQRAQHSWTVSQQQQPLTSSVQSTDAASNEQHATTALPPASGVKDACSALPSATSSQANPSPQIVNEAIIRWGDADNEVFRVKLYARSEEGNREVTLRPCQAPTPTNQSSDKKWPDGRSSTTPTQPCHRNSNQAGIRTSCTPNPFQGNPEQSQLQTTRPSVFSGLSQTSTIAFRTVGSSQTQIPTTCALSNRQDDAGLSQTRSRSTLCPQSSIGTRRASCIYKIVPSQTQNPVEQASSNWQSGSLTVQAVPTLQTSNFLQQRTPATQNSGQVQTTSSYFIPIVSTQSYRRTTTSRTREMPRSSRESFAAQSDSNSTPSQQSLVRHSGINELTTTVDTDYNRSTNSSTGTPNIDNRQSTQEEQCSLNDVEVE